uniref:Uncharacterized protein n=1 Tax=Arundo donax TaxID=35708 RepID=A0A0A9H4R9_ARUDO
MKDSEAWALTWVEGLSTSATGGLKEIQAGNHAQNYYYDIRKNNDFVQ